MWGVRTSFDVETSVAIKESSDGAPVVIASRIVLHKQ